MQELILLIKKDIIAYDNNLSLKKLKFRHFIYRYVKTPGFKVTTTMRICKYLGIKKALKPLYYLMRLKYRRLQVKYGIQIGHQLSIGGGLLLIIMVVLL